MIRRIYLKFAYAIEGLIAGFKHDTSIKVQAFFGVLACTIGFIFGFDKFDWIILLILIGLVLAFEFMNSVLEKICDFIEPEKNATIKVIKDLSSAAVLVMALIAFVVGLILVLGHIH